MIVDWQKFVSQERPRWERLEAMLKRLEADPWTRLSLVELKELETLYQRTVADLARVSSLELDPTVRAYLENLVARAYSEVHGGQGERKRWRPWQWFSQELPRAFRRQLNAFWFALLLFVVGSGFGAAALAFDAGAKEVIMPFSHLHQSPSQRVAKEESAKRDRMQGHKAAFSGMLMTHNTQVSLSAMALGLSWGLGTLVLMFYNGVILGAVAFDYIADGQLVFLLGWLLPHGVVEIPAMLVGGQAGFVLARAIIGRDQRRRLSERLRAVIPDLATLAGGVAIMLVWAGIIESFFSQYHEPFLPYWLKISFGVVEFAALVWFLGWCGRARAGEQTAATRSGKESPK